MKIDKEPISLDQLRQKTDGLVSMLVERFRLLVLFHDFILCIK